jgi:siroheme synthase-like protein
MNNLFPIFLKLDQIQTLIVGGGNVGLEKLNAIINNCPSANITLVSPYIKPEIVELASMHTNIKLQFKKFEWDDLNDKQLVICATDQPLLHEQIQKIARRRQILINVADTPTLCDFYLSSIVQKGDLKIAISTNGKSPTFAKRLKEVLDDSLDGENINELLHQLEQFREKIKGDFNTKVKVLNELTQQLR